MSVLVRVVLAVVLLCAGAAVRAEDAFTVIVLPYTNAAQLMKVHQPLREYLQKQLGRPVELYSAADYVAHFEDIKHGDFHMAITGPHFGAWAVDHGARPLLRYRAGLSPLLVVARGGGIDSAAQMRGKVVGLSNRYSTSSLAGERWLADLGLIAGRDYTLRFYPTHTAAIMATVMGEADAALTTHTPVRQAPDDIRARIREIVGPLTVPHLFTIAGNRLPADEVEPLKAALMGFAETAEGGKFFAETGYQGYAPLSDDDVAAMRPIVDLMLAAMESGGS